jgi:hypothetical protein
MEGTCKYIEYAIADMRQGVVLQLGGLGLVSTTPHRKKLICYKMFQSASERD